MVIEAIFICSIVWMIEDEADKIIDIISVDGAVCLRLARMQPADTRSSP